jgi:hypothetical protein
VVNQGAAHQLRRLLVRRHNLFAATVRERGDGRRRRDTRLNLMITVDFGVWLIAGGFADGFSFHRWLHVKIVLVTGLRRRGTERLFNGNGLAGLLCSGSPFAAPPETGSFTGHRRQRLGTQADVSTSTLLSG